jgi:hypothetical protein
MAFGAPDPWFSLDEITLIQHILSFFIPVMAVCTRKIRFQMTIVRKDDRGPLFLSEHLRIVQFHLIRLGLDPSGKDNCDDSQ